jgi:NAD(P)H-flavin reductase
MASPAEVVRPRSDAGLVPEILHVVGRWRETRDTCTLELARADASPLPGFMPGQFNMLYAFGIGEIPVSFSGDPAVTATWTHTIRAVGPVSRALAGLTPGDALGVRGPFGTGWPVAEAAGHDVLFVAGGLGLAPLRPALAAVLADRQRYGKVTLLYGTRSPADILYRAGIERWRRRLDVDIEVTVDHADDSWRGNVGVVTKLLRRAAFDPGSTLAMLCGPEIMMRFALEAIVGTGVPAERIHLSMERNMKCAVGHCGHCQFGPYFVCRDGAVFRSDAVSRLMLHPGI